MTRLTKLALGVLAVAAGLGRAEAAVAQSWGALHLPSTTAQYLGYGYGAGHHAPIVHTRAQRPPRMPRRVRSPARNGPLLPEAYAPVGCYGGCCADGETILFRAGIPASIQPAALQPMALQPVVGAPIPMAALPVASAPLLAEPALEPLPPVDELPLVPLPPAETADAEPLPPATMAWATLRGVRAVR